MSQGFIVGKGGGMNKGPIKKGTIVVTYPEGSVCTVTNGSKTYTALDTSGAAAFAVEPGEWTVRAYGADGDESENVIVPSGGWVEVDLNFVLWLFKNGDKMIETTGGFYFSDGGNAALTFSDNTFTYAVTSNKNGNSYFQTQNPIDLSEYKTLFLNVLEYTQTGSSTLGIAVYSSRGATVVASAETVVGLVSLDVSSLDGEYYIGSHNGWNTPTSYTADKMWLAS